jgi:pSer/pThr/pTyr-binding forkhead associated (FHA) protein
MAAGTKVQLRLGERVVAEVAFEGAELRIGRMKENDLVINNLAVSRFHAVLRRVGDGFEIEDLGSENGSFVEGVAVRGAAAVPVGAAITIGKHTLTLRAGGEAGARPVLAARAARPLQAQPGRSDVWDAAQTYFVAGPAPREEDEEEAVAVAVEVEREDDGAAQAVEAAPEVAPAVEPPHAPRAEPLPLDLPDDAVALAFDEDELVGAAAPDPVAAEAADVSVEPAELEPLDELSVSGPAPSPAALRPEPGAQTALFDFGLSEDLGLSDGSLARAALGRAAPAPASVAPAPAPAPAALHAGLIVERHGRVERIVPWAAAELVAGRAPDCDLVLGAGGVSRRHARFVHEGDAFRVLDLASANGIRVNGKKVESAALAVGDVVGIDDYTVTFVLDREPVEDVVRSAPMPAGAVKCRAPVEAADAPVVMSERDLLLEAEDESLLVDAEKELERSASRAAASAGADVAASWRFEIAIATERLPAALRRALAELGEDELRLPAELRLVRRA